MSFDPARPPTWSTSLAGPLVAAAGGSVLLAVSAHAAGLGSTPAAIQLSVALQTVSIVLLLVAAAFCASRWQVDASYPSLLTGLALAWYAVGTATLSGLAKAVTPGPVELQAEMVSFLVAAAVASLALAALRRRNPRAEGTRRRLVLHSAAGALASVAVVTGVSGAVALLDPVGSGTLTAAFDIGTAMLWAVLSAGLWLGRAGSGWRRRGSALALVLVGLEVVDSTGSLAAGDAVDLATTMFGAGLSATVCWWALLGLAQAVARDRARVRGIAQQLDEVTEKVLARDAWREELRHDAVNSLTGLKAALSLLSQATDHLDGETQGRLLRSALSETNHLEHLVRGGEGTPTVFDVAQVIEAVAVSRRAGGLEVMVTGRAGAPLPRPGSVLVHGSPGDVATVLQNLLHNAGRHAAGSEVVVEVAQVADRVLVSVRDDGPGIPDHLRDVVFDRGVRGPASAGEGLGLYVGRRLMRSMGGDLEHVPSRVGCRLVLTVPAATSSQAGSAEPGTPTTDSEGRSRCAA